MRRRERIAEPTARARSGHAACDAAFPIPRRPRHASRPALRFPWCGRWFRDQRAVGAGLRIDRPRPVGGGAARPGGFRLSDVGSAHCANKAVASLRICSPASRAPVASSLRGSRGCPSQMRIKAPLYPTPPAHPSVGQQSRPLRHRSRRGVAALPSGLGSVIGVGPGRKGHDSCGSLGAPPAPAASGLGGALQCAARSTRPVGSDDGRTPWKDSRHQQAPVSAKWRFAPGCAGFPFVTARGGPVSKGMAFGPRDRRFLVGISMLLPFWRKEH